MNKRVIVPVRHKWALLVLMALLWMKPVGVRAHDAMPHGAEVTTLVGFDQRLGAQVPHDLVLRDEQGQRVRVGDLLGSKPVILALAYFECETLCPLVRHGLVEAVRPLAFAAGDEFDVIMVSIDPAETAEVALRAKTETVAQYGRGARGWHFLTGEHAAVDTLADAIGFRFAYDAARDEYAHPSGVVLLTPEGKIARYFFGIEFDPQDLRLGLVETAQERIGTPIDRLLLLCYHYDPVMGKYSLAIMKLLRGAGVLTVALMALMIWRLRRGDAGGRPPDASPTPV